MPQESSLQKILTYIGLGITSLLGFLLYRSNKKLDTAHSDLASLYAQAAIGKTKQEMEQVKANSDNLEETYRKMIKDYESQK